MQLKTHQEDFEQERRDRVRIHEEKEKLKQELESQAQVIKMLVGTLLFTLSCFFVIIDALD